MFHLTYEQIKHVLQFNYTQIARHRRRRFKWSWPVQALEFRVLLSGDGIDLEEDDDFESDDQFDDHDLAGEDYDDDSLDDDAQVDEDDSDDDEGRFLFAFFSSDEGTTALNSDSTNTSTDDISALVGDLDSDSSFQDADSSIVTMTTTDDSTTDIERTSEVAEDAVDDSDGDFQADVDQTEAELSGGVVGTTDDAEIGKSYAEGSVTGFAVQTEGVSNKAVESSERSSFVYGNRQDFDTTPDLSAARDETTNFQDASALAESSTSPEIENPEIDQLFGTRGTVDEGFIAQLENGELLLLPKTADQSAYAHYDSFSLQPILSAAVPQSSGSQRAGLHPAGITETCVATSARLFTAIGVTLLISWFGIHEHQRSHRRRHATSKLL